MSPQLVGEVLDVDAAVGVLADRHDVGDRFAPRQLVGMVLVRPDEHHRALRTIEPEKADELVDRTGRPGAAEQHHIVVAAVDRPADDAAGLLAQRGGAAAGRRSLGVGVAVRRQHLIADEVLHERERAARRGRVGVDHAPGSERAVEHRVVADHRATDPIDQPPGRVGLGRASEAMRGDQRADASSWREHPSARCHHAVRAARGRPKIPP